MKKLIALILAATLLLACAIPAQAADSRKAEAAAVLYDLGLFQGTGTNADGTPDFSLDRAAKRAEGVTLLVRLLGIGEETLKNASDAPFTDVPGWAKPYVNFAYENDLTKGVSADKLGANDAVTRRAVSDVRPPCDGLRVRRGFRLERIVGADRPPRHHARRIQRKNKQVLPARRRGARLGLRAEGSMQKRQNAL